MIILKIIFSMYKYTQLHYNKQITCLAFVLNLTGKFYVDKFENLLIKTLVPSL
jgi:hypothetical protein